MRTDDMPTLRHLLDSGRSPRELLPRLDVLLDDAHDALLLTATKRHEIAAARRGFAHAALAGSLPEVPGLEARVSNGSLALTAHWGAELLEEPDLARRLLACLDDPDYTAHAELHDAYRSPHPLLRHTPAETWSCAHCGNPNNPDTAECIEIGDREGHSDLSYPIRYCLDCIGFAQGA